MTAWMRGVVWFTRAEGWRVWFRGGAFSRLRDGVYTPGFQRGEGRLGVSRSAWPEAARSYLPGFHAEVGVGAEQAASHRALACGGRLGHRSRRKDLPPPRPIPHRSFEWRGLVRAAR